MTRNDEVERMCEGPGSRRRIRAYFLSVAELVQFSTFAVEKPTPRGFFTQKTVQKWSPGPILQPTENTLEYAVWSPDLHTYAQPNHSASSEQEIKFIPKPNASNPENSGE